MAIQTGSDPESGQPTVTFSIAARDGAAVSVVGSFNDWTPGRHTFVRRDDGTLAVTVLVRAGEGLHFRYLDSDGTWFDDAEADTITEYGSFISATRLTVDPGHDAVARQPRRVSKPRRQLRNRESV